MASDGPARVYVSGDREGAYLVAEERPDGSLVLTPDASRRARPRSPQRSGDELGGLAQLLRRRPDVVRTTDQALDDWGVELLEGELVVEFALADVNEQHGFVALTNQRLIFLVRGRTALEPRLERRLSGLQSVELIGRGRRRRLAVGWAGSGPMVIDCPDRAQLERLEARLRAR